MLAPAITFCNQQQYKKLVFNSKTFAQRNSGGKISGTIGFDWKRRKQCILIVKVAMNVASDKFVERKIHLNEIVW